MFVCTSTDLGKQEKLHVNMYAGNSVGIATRYGLDVSGFESRWGRDFPHPSRPSLGSSQPSIQWVPSHVSGGKVAVAWR